MNPFEQMQLKQSSYTSTDRQVHDVIVNNIDAVLRGSATSLAEDFGISQPAITRFCKKLGYHGFSDFKIAVYQHHKSAAMTDSPSTVIDYYCSLLRLVPGAMEQAETPQFIDRLLNSRLVTSTGFHKSALPAQLLNLNLIKFGLATSFIPYDQLAPEQMLTERDTLVIFSATSKVYKECVESIRELDPARRPYVVLVTMNAKNPLRNKVDQVIWLPNYQNQNYAQYLESQIVFMVFVDLLTNAIAQRTSR